MYVTGFHATQSILVFITDMSRLRRAAQRRRLAAFRPGTQGNRWSHALLYIAFCIYFRISDFPTALGVLFIYGEFLARSYTAARSVTNALSSLRTFHLIFGFSTASFDNFQFNLWRRALPLTLRTAPRPAPALPIMVLERLCSEAARWGERGQTFAALLSTAFFSLARLSSLVPAERGPVDASRVPLLSDLVVRSDRANLRLKWGKAAQEPGQEFWVPLLPVEGAQACPLALLRALAARAAGKPLGAPLFSFSRNEGTPGLVFFTLATARKFLAQLLQRIGFHNQGFTFHSLRRGGCTLAFSSGAELTDLQLLGGWRSRAIDAYYPHLEARRRAAGALARGSSALLAHQPPR